MAVVALSLTLGTAKCQESTHAKLRKAFPGDAAVVNSRFVWFSKDGVLVAFSQFKLCEDGRLLVTDCYIARWPAKAEPSAQPTAVRSNRAYLKLSVPIKRIEDIRDRKLLNAELDAGVRLDFVPNNGKQP
jgi:hypothetical protein